MPWSPKEGPPRELRHAWEGLRPGEADPLDVAASARSRLNEILFRQLRIRKILDKRMLARAAKYVVACLDLRVSRGESAAWHLVGSFGAFKGWISAFDEAGAYLLAQDSYDGWSLSAMRKAAESLRCVGVVAEVVGPFNYPRRSDASSLMGKSPSYAYVQGYCLRRGELWALKVAEPRGGWR